MLMLMLTAFSNDSQSPCQITHVQICNSASSYNKYLTSLPEYFPAFAKNAGYALKAAGRYKHEILQSNIKAR